MDRLGRTKKHGLLDKTAIYPIKLEDLPYFQLKERVHEARTRNPTRNGSSIKDTANYIITIWSKFHFLRMIADKNPFGTTHIGWIDFGLTHVANTKYVDDLFTSIPDQFKILLMKWFVRSELNDPSYFDFYRGNIATGYFTAEKNNMLNVCSLFHDRAMDILKKGYGATEEQILPFLMDQYPDLFTFYYGDYDGILSNYQSQRISIPTTLMNLSYCVQKREFKKGLDIGNRVKAGTLELQPDQLKTFTELYETCLKNMGTIESYLELYQQNPDNPEPLYQIAKHFRLEGKQQLGYMFARRSLQCKDRSLSDKIKEEISICAYYTGDRKVGYQVSDELLLDRKVSSSVKDMVRSNIFFYLEQLNPEFIPMDITLPKLSATHRYNPLNPSIIRWKDGYLINCRTVNYEKKGDPLYILDGSGCIRTRNILCEYTSEMKKMKQWEVLDDSKGPIHGNIVGLEDLRLLEWKDEVWFTATSWLTGAVPQMVLCQLDSNLIHVKKKYLLIGPNGEFHSEKNWLPYVHDDVLYLIYSHEPYIILKVPEIPDTHFGKISCLIHHESSHKHCLAGFKGSCSPIPYKSGYLGLIHETIQRERRYYVERFVWYDSEMKIKKVSVPFNFLHKGIEFNCGMISTGSEIIIGWSKEDSSVGLVKMKSEVIKDLLYDLE